MGGDAFGSVRPLSPEAFRPRSLGVEGEYQDLWGIRATAAGAASAELPWPDHPTPEILML
jgi:hypothetical protein